MDPDPKEMQRMLKDAAERLSALETLLDGSASRDRQLAADLSRILWPRLFALAQGYDDPGEQ